MKKLFVLDTSVLLHSPSALYAFPGCEVIIPVVVLNEIDTFKRGSLEINRNARHVIAELDKLRGLGNLQHGITVSPSNVSTILIKVEVNHRDAIDLLPPGFDASNDNRILSIALWSKKRSPRRTITVISKDIAMRVKAQVLGLQAEDFIEEEIQTDYTGITSNPKEANYPHSFLVHEHSQVTNPDISRTMEITPSGAAVRCAIYPKQPWGIKPLNTEQRAAIELLTCSAIHLVTITGKAGTGKTMLALAAGLEQVLNEKKYRKLSVYRPLIPMGKDIGYLPGSEQEKLGPWMHPIFDNLEYLLDTHGVNKGKNRGMSSVDYLIESGNIEVAALTYIRGRSIPGLFIIIDEAQNLTPHEVKTILTRAGEGTKIILTGDPGQIDSPYLDKTSNGLTYAVNKFKHEAIAGHITLTKGERSRLAERSADIL